LHNLRRTTAASKKLLFSISLAMGIASILNLPDAFAQSIDNVAVYSDIGFSQSSQNTVAALNWQGRDIYIYDSNDSVHTLWYSIGGANALRVGGITTTFAAPALAPLNTNLYLFHVGIDGMIYWDRLSSQNTFNGNWLPVGLPVVNGVNLPVSLTNRPSAIGLSNGRLLITATFIDGSMRYTTMSGFGVSSGWNEMPGDGLTAHGMSLTSLTESNNAILASHTGTDGHIYFSVGRVGSFNQITWDDEWSREPGNGSTPSAPSLLSIPSQMQVYLAVEGDGGDNRPWAELLHYDNDADVVFHFEVPPADDAFTPIQNGNVDEPINAAPALANLRGNNPPGQFDPNIIVGRGHSSRFPDTNLNELFRRPLD
jgi:hypothetical protein